MKAIAQNLWNERRLLFPAFSASFALPFLPLIVLPWLFSALVSAGGYSQLQAGWLAGLEIGAVATTSLAFAGLAARPSRRAIAGAGVLAAMLAEWAGTWLVFSGLPFAVTRIVAGIGLGLSLAAGTGSVADSRNPSRAFACLWFLFALWELLTFNAIPFLLARFGLRGMLAFPGIACAFFLPVILRLPEPASRPELMAVGRKPNVLRAPPILVLSTFFFFSMRDTLVYAFSEQLAIGSGLTSREFGASLGFGAVLALAGPIAADWLGSRKLRYAVAGGALGVLFVSGAMLFTHSSAVFMGSSLLYPGLGMFVAALLSALAVRVDRTGRTAVIGSSIFCLCQALGAPLGATLVQYFGRVAFSSLVLTSGLITLLCGILSTRYTEEPSRPSSNPTAMQASQR